ncbi:MAG: exonuclease domain-containing protein [Hydrogenophaga sp.]|uniref:exonuclease domain-containing protein n=1 Tax=Hydrogenophaga sp. TaxID=1904254 RepID=UPI00271BEEDC|nr:exonuclease domain-containing protein [Hydrogenophaga sp.]MDO9507150.1 exonuclease domain-containing protein [Hydrogenophaga sp.]MDP3625487.1 exonuclease domain-containing protein [Hydrogenophaga sp.]
MSRRRVDRRLWLGVALAGVALLLWLVATAGIVWSTLDGQERERLVELLASRSTLVVMMVLVLMAALAFATRALVGHFIEPVAQLAEEGMVLVRTDVARSLPPQGSAENRAVTGVINQLVAQRTRLREEMDVRVQEASRDIEQEKGRLAALMAELTQSVVVCNLDGRILLYNQRAKQQFRALSQAPEVAGGAELIGLGRSIYAVFDRKLVAHALENIQQRMLSGVAQPSAQFVTSTAVGQLLRVQMAPVRSSQAQAAEDTADRAELTGFVLMLDNITREFEAESARDRVLHTLTEGTRSALANTQAALDVLDHPELEPAARERFLRVVREETAALGRRIAGIESDAAQSLKTRWPLEDMLGADLVSAALRRIEIVTGLPASALDVNPALWLKVESFSLLQVLVYLAGRLSEEFGVRYVQVRLETAAGSAGKAQFDLVWSGQAMSNETVMSWEMDAMTSGAETTGLTVRDVVERHGGAFWFERERSRHQAFFRILLPLADPRDPADAINFVRNESRPEYYDFDLFKTTEQTRSLDERRLVDLVYTVFDTETTGLEPGQGDEIIQIGAARIVNGKLLRQECFEQLVDPRRSIPAASIPIHGIQPAMVVGQPTISEVLPAFHAFAQDTVLVAHNAAFDMRFLQLKEKSTGVVFDQPVLDTLLLSAVIHPNQDSHRLEAIAERFDVPVIGRHTAMGDAMVTAEIFIKLIPLLAQQGIHTLGQAREAAQKTYYARLKY